VHGNSKSASNALDAVGDDLGSWTRRGSHRQNYHIDPLTYKIGPCKVTRHGCFLPPSRNRRTQAVKEEDVVVVQRTTYHLAADDLFRKIICLTEDLVGGGKYDIYIEYVGDVASGCYHVHGNSKSGRPFTRTPRVLLHQMAEEVKRQKPKVVYRARVLDNPEGGPRDSKQVKNLKFNSSSRSDNVNTAIPKSDPYMGIAEQILTENEESFDGTKFIREMTISIFYYCF